MKKSVVTLALIAMCSLGSQTLYAGKWDTLYVAGHTADRSGKNGLFTKRCPDCEGTGRDGWYRCDNCDGSGKVHNWFTIIIIAGAIVLVALAEFNGGKKS